MDRIYLDNASTAFPKAPGTADAIKAYLEANPEAKLSQAADASGMSLSSVKKVVSSLKRDGVLRNDGTNRNSRWVVLRGCSGEFVRLGS